MSRLREASPDAQRWSRLFPIFTGAASVSGEKQPPIVGRYDIESRAIRFQPHFPFTPGLTYYGRFDGELFDALVGNPAGTTPDLEATFAMPLPERDPTTRVEAIYPSSTLLPENLLRLYVHFSAPMGQQEVHRYIHLYDSAGDAVHLPFVEIERGLWDPAMRRLTLLFHPGRIKRGVAPGIELGMPLREGETYRLAVGREMLDANGYPLAEAFEKTIVAGPADRRSPDHREWRIATPAARFAPLVIDLSEPLDHALLLRWIVIETAAGMEIGGEVSVSRDESRWSFRP